MYFIINKEKMLEMMTSLGTSNALSTSYQYGGYGASLAYEGGSRFAQPEIYYTFEKGLSDGSAGIVTTQHTIFKLTDTSGEFTGVANDGQ